MQQNSWLFSAYSQRKAQIQQRLEDFKQIWKAANNEKLFQELCFCLLTPQSKAKTCWKAVEDLHYSGVLYDGNASQVIKHLKGVRFPFQKSKRVVLARKQFFSNKKTREILQELEKLDNSNKREWLVQNVLGYGYKEAAHFLRNIGFYENIAILDRHILKNLIKLNVIEEVPKTLTKKKYMEIEE